MIAERNIPGVIGCDIVVTGYGQPAPTTGPAVRAVALDYGGTLSLPAIDHLLGDDDRLRRLLADLEPGVLMLQES